MSGRKWNSVNKKNHPGMMEEWTEFGRVSLNLEHLGTRFGDQDHPDFLRQLVSPWDEMECSRVLHLVLYKCLQNEEVCYEHVISLFCILFSAILGNLILTFFVGFLLADRIAHLKINKK